MQAKREYEKYNYKAGDTFGRLTLTGKTYFIEDKGGTKRRMVTAQCQCGKIRDYVLDLLKRGETKSCGCLQKDLLRQQPHNITHGLTNHPLYRVWDGMKQRCYNPKSDGFENWGGRNITITPLWKDDFKAFYDWAIKNGWARGLEIDRRNNDGNYEPSNCWFRTPAQQNRNKRSNHWICCWNETKCLMDWSLDARCKVPFKTLHTRLVRDKDKWPDIEKAITTPPISREDTVHQKLDLDKTMIFAFNETKSINEWLKDERCLADIDNIKNRRKKGWSGDRIIGTKVRAERQK